MTTCVSAPGGATAAGRYPAGLGDGGPRLLPDRPGAISLAAHLDRYGPLPGPAGGPGGAQRGQAAAGLIATGLIAAVEAAGLTGRGGAAFPVYRKLAAVAGQPGPRVVIANGAESEPASRKDVTLLWRAPQLVLDGLQAAAAATGASRAVLYLHDDPRLREWLTTNLASRAAAGLDRWPVEVITAPPGFLSGQESAVVRRIGGGPARPEFRTRLTAERGVSGRPTLVQNVETLAHLALIARYGPGWFRRAGTAAEPGTMLCSVLAPTGQLTVTELELGAPLRGWLGLGRDVQAVLCGGYHGTWLSPAAVGQLTLANAELRPAGAAVGAGVLIALPGDRCGLAETARVARYLALNSAGQCGPCFSGLPRIAAALGDLADPARAWDPESLGRLARWSGLVTGRGACHHPDGAARFVASALSVFAAEVAAHQRGQCRATSQVPFLPVPSAQPDPAGAGVRAPGRAW
jgi:NADH:ubiquinone oxidoreductase subunit F (NADH-binding)